MIHVLQPGLLALLVSVAELFASGCGSVPPTDGGARDGGALDAGGDMAEEPVAPFARGAVYPISKASRIALGDFNGDGKIDLAVNTGAGIGGARAVLLIGQGDGTFVQNIGTPLGEVFCEAIAVADFDRDGKLDVAVAAATRGTGPDHVLVLLGKGDGSFVKPAPSPVALWPAAIAVADLDRNGSPDLVAATREGGDLSVLLGDGKGSFAAAQHIAIGRTPSALAIADLDRDDKLDVIVALEGSYASAARDGTPVPGSGVAVLLGRGDGTFSAPALTTGGSAPNAVVAADWNGDGVMDVALSELRPLEVGAVGGIFVLLGKGDGSLKPLPGFLTGEAPYALATADFGGDSRIDLVASVPDFTAGGRHRVKLLTSGGDGSFALSSVASERLPGALVIADFNRDQRLDVAVATLPSAPTSSVSIFLGK
ncbi:MAG: VCBS repeat-containing protein [Myxococcales bacterium]|nr:VCBS repeat-containing protein [Myxococcales bacterium]